MRLYMIRHGETAWNKERRIQGAIFAILNDDEEVERIFKIIEKQEEY